MKKLLPCAMGAFLACSTEHGTAFASGPESSKDPESQGALAQHGLIGVRTTKANFKRNLINVGPRADGTLPDCYYERMKELAGWMRHSGVSVFDTKPGPFPERCNVPVTVREHTWYLHLASAFRNAVTISATTSPKRVTLLRTGTALVPEFKDGTLTIQVPSAQRTDTLDVVAVQWL